MTQKMVQQIQSDELADPERFRKALNNLLSDVQGRVSALEDLGKLTIIPAFELKTGASTAPGSAPFQVRLALPSDVTAAGVVVAGVRNLTPGGVAGLASVAHDAKWEAAEGGRALRLLHLAGLQANKTYEVRLVVLRG